MEIYLGNIIGELLINEILLDNKTMDDLADRLKTKVLPVLAQKISAMVKNG